VFFPLEAYAAKDAPEVNINSYCYIAPNYLSYWISRCLNEFCFYPNPVASELLLKTSMGFLYEKLEVYQKAVEFAEAVFKLTDELPRGQRALADQFKRAAMSISLNKYRRGQWPMAS